MVRFEPAIERRCRPIERIEIDRRAVPGDLALGQHDRANPEIPSGQRGDQQLRRVRLGIVGSVEFEYAIGIGTGDAGRFRVAELPEGEFTLTVSDRAGKDLYEEKVILEAGKTLTRSLRLSRSEAKEPPTAVADPPLRN